MIKFEQSLNTLTINYDLISLFSLDFIKEYHVIPYTTYENKIVLLFAKEVDFFNLMKIRNYIEDDFYVLVVTLDEWNEIFSLFNLMTSRNNAVINYEMQNKETKNNVLREDNMLFYNEEITNYPIVKIVDSILGEAIALKSSDIHFEPSEGEVNVRFRIDGKLLEKAKIPTNTYNEIVGRIKILSNLDITKKFIPQDGKLKFIYDTKEYDIRVSILPTIYAERIALRVLDLNKGAKKIEELGLNKEDVINVKNLINSSSGLVLVVGPTGSGKSTTLQTFLTENVQRKENIITVEDPVEYTVEGVNQVQINEEAGLTFAGALRSILRQDPNIIMIGEIRDLETAQIACRASITGHLVYSTLHSNSSIGAINRLVDMECERYLLVDALRGIISQRLVRKLCPYCKKEVKVSSIEKEYLGVDEDFKIFKPLGCGLCNKTGYLGRQAIYEIFMIDDDFRNLINEGASLLKYQKMFKKKNIKTLEENGIELIKKGITTIEELKAVVN